MVMTDESLGMFYRPLAHLQVHIVVPCCTLFLFEQRQKDAAANQPSTNAWLRWGSMAATRGINTEGKISVFHHSLLLFLLSIVFLKAIGNEQPAIACFCTTMWSSLAAWPGDGLLNRTARHDHTPFHVEQTNAAYG